MHFVRRDYVFFYDKGIVCYKATPVPPKRVIRQDKFCNKQRISENLQKYETDQESITYVNEPRITLVPPKPLNLLDSLKEEEPVVDKKDDRKPKIRPYIVLNTLYSLVYPFTETGNTYIFPRNKEEVKHEDKPIYSKPSKVLNKNVNEAKCNKCTGLNRFDKNDYMYTCPETISPNRTKDLLLNRSLLRKPNVTYDEDHNDMSQQYKRKDLIERERSLSYKIVREKTFTEEEKKLTVSENVVFERQEPDDFGNNSLEIASEHEPAIPKINMETSLDKIRSRGNLTINSLINSLDKDQLFVKRMANYQQSDLPRTLSNEEICEVIESPNVIRSAKSFIRQLSRLSSNKTIRSDSNTFTKDLISHKSKEDFENPVKPKSSESKPHDSPLPLKTDPIKSTPPDVKREKRPVFKHPAYLMPGDIKPFNFTRKKFTKPPMKSTKEPTKSSNIKTEDPPVTSTENTKEVKEDPIKGADGNLEFDSNKTSESKITSPSSTLEMTETSASNKSISKDSISTSPKSSKISSDEAVSKTNSNISYKSIKSGLKDNIPSNENLNKPIVVSDSSYIINDYKTGEFKADKQNTANMRERDDFVRKELEYANDLESEKIIQQPIQEDVSNAADVTYKSSSEDKHEEDNLTNDTNAYDPIEKDKQEKKYPEEVHVEEVEQDKQEEKEEEEKVDEPPKLDKKESVEKGPPEIYINNRNKEVIRPLKNTRNKILIKGFEATVFIINANKTATSSLCNIMFDYNEDLLIIKSEHGFFEMKATDLTCEEIPTSSGSPILLKISLNKNQFSAIVLQTYDRKNLEMLAGTIGWVTNINKDEFKDKAPRMNVRKSLFAGLKRNKRKDGFNNNDDENSDKQVTSCFGYGNKFKAEQKSEFELEEEKKLFNRMRRRKKAMDAAKYF